MKLFFSFLKTKNREILYFIFVFAVFAVMFLLYHLPIEAVLYPSFICLLVGFAVFGVSFHKHKKLHESLLEIKELASSLIISLPETSSLEIKDYQDIIMNIKSEMTKNENKARKEYSDMVEYYTTWAHQIKTPIASMRLTLQNDDTELSREILRDLFKIEQYVEMVLMFVRLSSESSDYVLKEYSVDEIIKSSVKKYKSEFISRKNSLEYEKTELSVVTDEKWLSFVIEQILSNALKYTFEGMIKIYVTSDNELTVEDNGIGISQEDLPRVFEKGYTGYNGRTDKKASGIGLYLCKNICKKLGHTISIESEVDKGTKVKIDLKQKRI